ncbi:hypothetical protein CDIK_0100 [Cucumispora dikerogammari]|nr:hypothetical protein CDIK_0100 [Cucumispora dikerogammari]
MLHILHFISKIKNDDPLSSLAESTIDTLNTPRTTLENTIASSHTENLKNSFWRRQIAKKDELVTKMNSKFRKQGNETVHKADIEPTSGHINKLNISSIFKEKSFSNTRKKLNTEVKKIKAKAAEKSKKLSNEIDNIKYRVSSKLPKTPTTLFSPDISTTLKDKEHDINTGQLNTEKLTTDKIREQAPNSSDREQIKKFFEKKTERYNDHNGDGSKIFQPSVQEGVNKSYVNDNKQKRKAQGEVITPNKEKSDKRHISFKLFSNNNQTEQSTGYKKHADALKSTVSSTGIQKKHFDDTEEDTQTSQIVNHDKNTGASKLLEDSKCGDTYFKKVPSQKDFLDVNRSAIENNFDIKEEANSQESVDSERYYDVEQNTVNQNISNIKRSVENKNNEEIFERKMSDGINSDREAKKKVSEKIETETDIEQEENVVKVKSGISNKKSLAMNSTEPEKGKGKYIIITVIVILVSLLIGKLVMVLLSNGM